MQFTKNELAYLSQHVAHSDHSGLARYQRHLNEQELSLVLVALHGKGILPEANAEAAIVDGMLAVLAIIASPERAAHFELRNGHQLMIKSVFTSGDKRILLEYLQEDVMVSLYDNEAESVRQEISNQTGVSFQKPVQLSLLMDQSALVTLLAALDALRSYALQGLTGNSEYKPESLHLSAEQLHRFWLSPLKQGVVAELSKAIAFGEPDAQQLTHGLALLVGKGLLTPEHHASTVLQTMAQFTLLPMNLITLSLTQSNTQASEIILQGSLKLALSLSESENSYQLECMTGVELLSRIDAYLSCPIMS